MKPQDFHAAITFLSAATLADPFLALCSAVAWLDPLALLDEPLIEPDYYAGGDEWVNIGAAWDISRGCFPAVYAEATQAIRTESSSQRLADQVCTAINRHLVGGELHDLEQIFFGIPFFGLGVDLTDTDFFADPQYAPLVEAYAWLGVAFDPEQTYSIPDNLPEAAQVADVLAFSLRQTGHPTHEKLAWLLDWMFSQTGNTAADYTNEEIYEMGIQPLAWEPNELEFNNLMHAEAVEIIGNAMQGLDLLLADEGLQAELRANVETVSKQMKRIKKEKPHDRHQPDAQRLSRSLRWTDRPQQPDEQRSPDDLESVQVRRANAA